MPAAYAISRQRTLRGMGATYSFRPRLRGMGQDPTATPPDIGTGIPDTGGSILGPLPISAPVQPSAPFVYGNPAPLIPATPIAAAPVPPTLGPPMMAAPPGVQFVFPSSGSVPLAPVAAAAPGTSWFDQQMIAGLPNSYLALGTVGLVLFLSMSGSKRRR
jgi:hypothetical protein